MKISSDSNGVSLEITPEDFKGLFGIVTGGLFESKEEKFLRVKDFMDQERPRLAEIARNVYRNKYNLINDDISLIYEENGYDGQLYDISAVNLNYEWTRTKVEVDKTALPIPSKSYVENLIDLKYGGDEEESPFEKRFCYRLVKYNKPTELYFEYSDYFDYINTCEYQYYLFAKSIIDKAEKIDSGKIKIEKLKRSISPFDFQNRYLVAGINTLLIFWDESNPIMYIHNRVKKPKETIAEAINVKHVVPAGTFQPIHMDDGNHETDFSFYTNLLREFGEELAGDKDLVRPKGILENVLERPSISPIHHLIKNIGRGKVYYGGVTFDCLTLKPEILTIMVLYRQDYEKFIGEINFTENTEGIPFAVKVTQEILKKYAFDPDMLPAGAGCFFLAHQNFDKIVADFAKQN